LTLSCVAGKVSTGRVGVAVEVSLGIALGDKGVSVEIDSKRWGVSVETSGIVVAAEHAVRRKRKTKAMFKVCFIYTFFTKPMNARGWLTRDYTATIPV